METAVKIRNSSTKWHENLRPRVGQIVEHNGNFFQNTNGRNQIPQIGEDNGWFRIGDNSGDVIECYAQKNSNDVLELFSDDQFSILIVPEFSKIYIDLLSNIQYRWGGSIYVELGVKSGWGFNGNEVTDNDFIGTINDKPIKFKSNDVPVGKLSRFSASYGYVAASENFGVAIGAYCQALNGGVAIGLNAGTNSGNNSIAIGTLATTIGNNKLNLGNWIYGDNGKIGIGTDSPTQKLDVNGDFRVRSLPDATDIVAYDRQLVSKADGTFGFVPRVEPPKKIQAINFPITTIDSSLETIVGSIEIPSGFLLANELYEFEIVVSIIEPAVYIEEDVIFNVYTNTTNNYPSGQYVTQFQGGTGTYLTGNTYISFKSMGNVALNTEYDAIISNYIIITAYNANVDVQTKYIGIRKIN